MSDIVEAPRPTVVVNDFTVSDDRRETHFTNISDLSLQLRLADVTSSNDIAGGSVAVLLDVDGGGYAMVVVDSAAGGNDLSTVEGAIDHLTHVRDQLR